MKVIDRTLLIIFVLPLLVVKAEAQATLENQLQALEVVSIEPTVQVIQLTVRNVSSKIITVIDFATSENTTLTIDSDFATDEVLLAPAARKTINIDLIPGQYNPTVHVLAVVFDDGTGEGVPARLDIIKNTRQGRLDQMRRITPFWSNLLNTAQTRDQQALGQLLASMLTGLSALPETPTLGTAMNNKNFGEELGLRAAKDSAIGDLQKLQKQMEAGLSNEILEHFIRLFKDQHDKVLAKLEKKAR
jgi:hypothetical protein